MQLDDRAALAKTLEQALVKGVDLSKVEILDYSAPGDGRSDQVRMLANDTMLSLIDNGQIGHCIHVTGEMRALSDPFHRRVCAELYKRRDAKFSMIYNIPEDYQRSPLSVGKWNARTWPKSRWIDRLSAFSLIGNDLVDVYALNTQNQIQFTVFGDRHVLLQGQHHDEPTGTRAKKRVWLLKSEALNGAFTELAQKLRDQAAEMPDALFKRFTSSVHSIASKEIIRRLLKAHEPQHIEKIIDSKLLSFDPDTATKLEALKAMSFVSHDNDTINITADGRAYFEALNE